MTSLLSLPCTTFGQFIGYSVVISLALVITLLIVLQVMQEVNVSEVVRYKTQVVFNYISNVIVIFLFFSWILTLFTDSCVEDIEQLF